MTYPYLKTTFNPNLDTKTIEIITKYWDMENGIFKNSPTDLRIEFNTTQPKLNSIVKDNSLTILFIEDCVDCEKPIEVPVTSQTTTKNKLKHTHYQCPDCRTRLNDELKEIEPKSRKLHRLKHAIKVKYWKVFTREEVTVLKKIIEYNDYKTLWRDFIQQDFEYYWPIIEKLDRFSLIDIQREPTYNSPIKTIYFLPELAQELEVNPGKNVSVESSLNFNIPKRLNRVKENQPEFSKKIVFDRDINIIAGTEYSCSVWVNSDGSINFEIKPTSELIAETDGTEGFGPKSIGEIIAKMRK